MGSSPNDIAKHMHECEAREWHRRYAVKVAEQGLDAAKEWMRDVLADISKRRGAIAGDRLRGALNELRSADQQRVGAQHPRPRARGRKGV